MKAKTKLTRLWGFLLALVMIVGMLPTTALAASPTYVRMYNENKKLISLNDGECLTANDATGASSYTGGSSYVARYDKSSGTLYLKDYHGVAADDQIYAHGDLNIVVENDSSFTTSVSATNNLYGIQAGGKLNISGSGKLTVTANGNGDVYGIYAKEGVTISAPLNVQVGKVDSSKNGPVYGIYTQSGAISLSGADKTITATGGTSSAYGVYNAANTSTAITNNGNIGISGKLTVNLNSGSSNVGIYTGSGGTITLDGATVNIPRNFASGIFNNNGNVVIKNNSDVTLTSDTSTGIGIYARYGGNLTIENSTVTVSAKRLTASVEKGRLTIKDSIVDLTLEDTFYRVVATDNSATNTIDLSGSGSVTLTASGEQTSAMIGGKVTATSGTKLEKGTYYPGLETYDGEYDGSSKTVLQFVHEAPAANPAKPSISVSGTYTYTGSAQTATVSGYDSATMNITGNVETNAGNYTVSVTSKTGQWADGTTDAVTADWSIQKANPIYVVPTGLEGTKGNALSTVTLPDGFTWADGTTEMNTTGNQTFPATFTPSDTDNYNVVNNISVTVNVKEAAPTTYKVTVTNGAGSGDYAEGETVTITANAAPADKVFDKWEVVSGSIILADANSATTTFIMPASAVSVKATYKNAPHTHTYNQETVKPEALKTPADCTRNAVYFKSCSCGAISTTDTFVAMDTALDHDWPTAGNWSKDADKHWYECSRCHEKKDEAAHDYGDDDICDTCTYDNSVPHTHNLTLVDENPATCTTPGNKAYYTCDGCDKWFEDATGSVEITDKTSVILTANGHTPSDWKFDADNHWKECTVVGCGVIIEDSKAAHTASDWITDTEATATTDGTKHKECTECGYVMETDTIPATGSGEHTHSYSSDWKSDSINHWHECSCGVKDDVAAHSFKWVVDKEATATKKGSKHEECKFCGYQRPAVEIPATGSTTKPTDPTESNPNTGALDDVPQTGDNSNMILWIVLLLASGLGVTGTVVYSKRKKYAK